jgi:hypothetical protein
MNLKNIKDDYSEKLTEILENLQSGVSYFEEMTADNVSQHFLVPSKRIVRNFFKFYF